MCCNSHWSIIVWIIAKLLGLPQWRRRSYTLYNKFTWETTGTKKAIKTLLDKQESQYRQPITCMRFTGALVIGEMTKGLWWQLTKNEITLEVHRHYQTLPGAFIHFNYMGKPNIYIGQLLFLSSLDRHYTLFCAVSVRYGIWDKKIDYWIETVYTVYPSLIRVLAYFFPVNWVFSVWI